LSGFHAENAGEMAGIVAGNFGASTSNLINKEPAAHTILVFFMISHLRGALLEKNPNVVVVDVHGVGYEVTIPVSVFSSLPAIGAEVSLYIHTHVREDALSLFGFPSAADKMLFEKLISVSGIGPKLAVTALSGLTSAELIAAIRTGAVDQLVKISGVGKKTAERMVLELRDKLDSIGVPARAAGAAPSQSSFSATEEDTISALMNFGSTRAAAENAVTKARSAEGANDFDALFRRALKLVR
jgi:Holliday junction DNA helicase RuvA